MSLWRSVLRGVTLDSELRPALAPSDGGDETPFGLPFEDSPRSQSDWPNPLGYFSSVALAAFSVNLLLSTLATDVPFSQRDWPNPRGLGSSASESYSRTAPGQAAPTVVSPVANFDFKNPIARTNTQALVSFAPNLLHTTLARPFRQTDWVNPRGRVLDQRVEYSSPAALLNSQLAAPFSQEDWPNPRAAQRPVDLLTYLDPSETWLLKDQFFGDPGQPPANLDWALPLAGKTAIREGAWYQNLLPTTLALPFAQRDWANPRGKIPQQPSDPQSLIALRAEVAAPFAQLDWANPRPRAFSATSDVPNTLGTLLSQVAIPFSQEDWPNPRGAKRAIELLGYLDASEIWMLRDTFFGEAGQPAANLDWPNPRGKAPLVHSITQGIPQSALLFTTPSPFAQYEWPLPLGAKRAIDLLTFADATRLRLIGQDTFFGDPGQAPAQRDWPNPRGYRQPTLSWAHAIPVVVLSPPVPFAQRDWVVPKAAAYSIALRTHIDPLKLNLRGQDKFFAAPGMGPKYDYPNPRGRRHFEIKSVFNDAFRLSQYSIVITDSTLRTYIVSPQGRIFLVGAQDRIVEIDPQDRKRIIEAQNRIRAIVDEDRVLSLELQNRGFPT